MITDPIVNRLHKVNKSNVTLDLNRYFKIGKNLE